MIRLMQEIWNEETIKQSEVYSEIWMIIYKNIEDASNNNNDKVKKDFRRRKISRWKE